jgi:hypothetical protein
MRETRRTPWARGKKSLLRHQASNRWGGGPSSRLKLSDLFPFSSVAAKRKEETTTKKKEGSFFFLFVELQSPVGRDQLSLSYPRRPFSLLDLALFAFPIPTPIPLHRTAYDNIVCVCVWEDQDVCTKKDCTRDLSPSIADSQTRTSFFFLDLNKSRSVVWPGSFLSLAPMLAVRLIKRKTISCWWWIECYILSCSSDVLHWRGVHYYYFFIPSLYLDID